ncbi:MAG: hypothetical protein K4305_06435 [Chlorobium sp.]|uniref:hypothetical protein n=1 Tax=Chlorobium sp. TaxID=1095 RepID=UPI002F42CDBD
MQISVILLAIVLAVSAAKPSGAVALPGEAPLQVTNAASQGLQSWLNLIPPKEINEYGFYHTSEFRKANPGNPIEVFYLRASSVRTYNGDNLSLLQLPSARRWVIPVIVDGRIRTLLTVAGDGMSFKVVRIGEAGVANQLNSILGHPYARNGKAAVRLVKVLGERSYSDFILLGATESDTRLIPLQSARTAFSLKTSDIYTQDASYPSRQVLRSAKEVLLLMKQNILEMDHEKK